MTDPTVSVLIDTYNHERFIAKAIDSVLAQRNVDPLAMEIIVVDDGSTDGTQRLLSAYGDRIRVHAKPNGGQGSAFNEGIELCKGNIIAFLDGDDWWHEDKLASVCAAFDRYPDICAAGHGIVLHDEVEGSAARLSPRELIFLRHGRREDVALFHQSMCYLGTSRLAVRRSALARMPKVPSALIFEADEFLFTLLPAIGRVAVLPQCLTFYRIHGNNLFQGSLSAQGLERHDAVKLAKRARIFECLAAELPPALERRGVTGQLLNDLMKPVRLTARRLKLVTAGGTRWENVCSEYEGLVRPGEKWTTGKYALAIGKLGLAAVLAPQTFFRLRTAYSGSVWRRLRERVVTADIKREGKQPRRRPFRPRGWG